MELRFAFAVDGNGEFQNKHFGDADKYIIFEHDSKRLVIVDEVENLNKNFDESQKHGSKKKGNAVINFLKQNKVNILVSKQFGKNIKMINNHFIPVLVSDGSIEDTIKLLERNAGLFAEELQNNTSGFEIFRVKNGELIRKK